MSYMLNAEATFETTQTWKSIHTIDAPNHSNKANMKGRLWRPNDIRGRYGPKLTWYLSYRWRKSRQNLIQEICPDRNRTRARIVTGEHATDCSTAFLSHTDRQDIALIIKYIKSNNNICTREQDRPTQFVSLVLLRNSKNDIKKLKMIKKKKISLCTNHSECYFFETLRSVLIPFFFFWLHRELLQYWNFRGSFQRNKRLKLC